MRIAFIGGTRFIGHVAAERALSQGHEVTVLHRGTNACEVKGASDVIVDRADADALRSALARIEPDAVVDTRAMNAAQAKLVADVVAPLGVSVVVISSADVYAQFGRLNGLPAPEPEAIVRETSPLTIPFPFRGLPGAHEGGDDYDKKEVEAAFGALERVTILRLPGVFGRRDPKRRFGAILDALEKGAQCTLPCRGGASWRKSFVDVEDVAHAIVLAASRRDAGRAVFNVAEAKTPTMRERAELIAAEVDVRITWDESAELPEDLGILGRMPNDFVLDTSSIRERLGFREVTSDATRMSSLVRALRGSRPGT
jgi:2'-hydroxyisoflavone reductase